jgi:hypothetical protein
MFALSLFSDCCSATVQLPQKERIRIESRISVAVQATAEMAEAGAQANRWDPQRVQVSLRQKNSTAHSFDLVSNALRKNGTRCAYGSTNAGYQVFVHALEEGAGDRCHHSSTGQFGPVYTSHFVQGGADLKTTMLVKPSTAPSSSILGVSQSRNHLQRNHGGGVVAFDASPSYPSQDNENLPPIISCAWRTTTSPATATARRLIPSSLSVSDSHES